MQDWSEALVRLRKQLANTEAAAALGNYGMALVYFGEAEDAMNAMGRSLLDIQARRDPEGHTA